MSLLELGSSKIHAAADGQKMSTHYFSLDISKDTYIFTGFTTYSSRLVNK